MTTNQTKGTDMQNDQAEQKKIVEKVLTTPAPKYYNDADQREAGFDNEDYR